MKKHFLKTGMAALVALALLQSCKKDGAPQNNNSNNNGSDNGNGEIIAPNNPDIAATQGFFLDGWQPKTFAAPVSSNTVTKPAAGAVVVTVDISKVITKVSKNLFGNNTNPFMGQYVDQPVLMQQLTDLSPNILRFPGGSLSDIYFWNGSNKAPDDAPAQLPDNTGAYKDAGYWYGNNTADWTFTLDNYYKVLQQTNSTGLITVNYGYARYGTSDKPAETAAHLAADWVRYDNGRTKYWEIGNENYGNWEAGYRINPAANKDGQPAILNGAIYGIHFKIFADSMRKAAAEVGNTGIKIGMVTTETDEKGNTSTIIQNWNSNAMATSGTSPDFYVVHNYYTPYMQNSTPEVILATPPNITLDMMNWVKTSLQKAGLPQKPVALDEWNIFSTGSKQMVSNVAGVHAVMTLGELIKNQYSMASRWDLANSWDNGNDHGLFSNRNDEPNAPAWNARPAFYYMYFFQKYFGDRMVNSSVAGSPDIFSYGSSFQSGQAGVVLVNRGSLDRNVTVTIKNLAAGNKYYYYTLNGGADNVPFSRKVYVNGIGPAGESGGPVTYKTIAANTAAIAGGIIVTVPARGSVFLVAEGK
ncbi:alpha-L-arabinofuranosidase [Mucilaginibacter sp. AK015]|uniref:alpha-L-arabinofuranosidase n=1 Tax=Mucilaginibacter sp. AK015 TaxID=2723072 RepID=UPI001619DF34|nr:alpha-L-arabinofuranosidase [Mucilaginibacter sp. AK015]MBB5396596.1 hypothetical protein [Mucilaginibacter sp. AK015]